MNFLGFLSLLFIGLKLSNIIVWSWWLVLLPVYGSILVYLSFIISMFIIGLFLGD